MAAKYKNNFERIVPAVPNYQSREVPVQDAFTFSEAIADTGADGIVIVDFASCLNLEIAEFQPELVQKLFRLDHEAWLGVKTLKDYLHYYPDKVSETGEAHSLCAWASPEGARASLAHEKHRSAVQFVIEYPKIYKYYQVGTTIMRKVGDKLQFEPIESRLIVAGRLVEHWSKAP